MICHHCKNEKWDKDICPLCGLNEKEALLSKAEELRQHERRLDAAESFEKYLQLDPQRMEVLRKWATCLCFEAVARSDNYLFEKASVALTQALEREWTWDQGHQFQVDLFIRFGKQKNLANAYQEISQKDQTRKAVCEKMIKIIRLAEKFKENPPAVATSLIPNWEISSLVKSFWFLFLGIPILLWAIYELSTFTNSKDEKHAFFVSFVFVILGFSILVLFLLSMNMHRKNLGKNL